MIEDDNDPENFSSYSQFELHITMGNEAMQTNEDVAFALHMVADRISRGVDGSKIMDQNGNCVGKWWFEYE